MNAALVAAWALALAAPRQDPAPQAPAAAVLDKEDALRRFYTAKNLSAAVTEIARAHRAIARVESLGKSASGLELHVVTLARLGDDDAGDRPALLLVGALGNEDLFGTELALATVRAVIDGAGRDPRIDDMLDRCVLHVVPCVDADRRERVFDAMGSNSADPALRPVAIDRNFPEGWDPLAQADAGPYPLSEREAGALAAFCLARPNIAVCQTFRRSGALAREPAQEWPEADRVAQRRLTVPGELDGLEAGLGAGTWLRFAYAQQGAFVFRANASFERRHAWSLPTLVEIQRLAPAAAASTLRLAAALPRLRAELAGVSAVVGEQWQIELDLANSGQLPTASAQARSRRACAPPSIEIEGATPVAAVVVDGGGSSVLTPRGQRIELPEIDGAAQLRVRIFVTGAADATVSLLVSAPRAGRVQLSALLR